MDGTRHRGHLPETLILVNEFIEILDSKIQDCNNGRLPDLLGPFVTCIRTRVAAYEAHVRAANVDRPAILDWRPVAVHDQAANGASNRCTVVVDGLAEGDKFELSLSRAGDMETVVRLSVCLSVCLLE